MSLFNIDYTFDNLIRNSSSGLEISSFVQVKDAIARRYKEIFGNDIDIDSTTADGQFIMMMSLMIYNAYTGLYYLSENLNPSSAQGAFLDRLCSFNNVFRKTASPSYAYVTVKYIGTKTSYNPIVAGNSTIQQIVCLDKSGNTWTWTEGQGVNGFATTFTPNTAVPLKFVCDEMGKITATAGVINTSNHGDIEQVLDQTTYPFEVWQTSDAVVGEDDESDEALRKRRLLEMGNSGFTVMNGLTGGILSIEGVKEVKAYNNVSQTTGLSANDGTTVNYHDTYICVRYDEGVSISDDEIGKMIYYKMTPGIVTTAHTDDAYGVNKSYTIDVFQHLLTYQVNWKKCTSIAPKLVLTFLANPDAFNEETKGIIRKAVKDYTFNLTIYDDLTIANLLSYINSCDPRETNQNTFIFVSGTVEIDSQHNTDTNFKNKDTYYDYTKLSDSKFVFVKTTPALPYDTWTLTING